MTNPIDIICQLPKEDHLLLILSYSVLEAWLGKTEKMKSSSVLELIFNLLLAGVKRLFNKGEKHE